MLGECFRPLLWNDKEISVDTRWAIFKEAIENTVGNLLGGLSKQEGAGQTSKQEHQKGNANRAKDYGRVEIKAENKAEGDFQRQGNLFRVQRSTRKTRCETEMEKHGNNSAAVLRAPKGGLKANVNEKVEPWKKYLAEHSHLPGYSPARPRSRSKKPLTMSPCQMTKKKGLYGINSPFQQHYVLELLEIRTHLRKRGHIKRMVKNNAHYCHQ